MFTPASDRAALATTANYEDAEVQFGMGLKFASGTGVPQDYAQAADWYRKAANQNHPLAQFNLAVMCAQGQGMDRDDAAAAGWFERAANQGDAGAQFTLARTCHRASLRGAPAETREYRIEAYKWYRLAAAQGYQGSETACTALILSMTREDVACGNERLASFKPEDARLPVLGETSAC